jgi:glycosyltransferase involved in cell wall biosynthesis
VIVPSQSVGAAARGRAGVSASQLVVIPNAVDPAAFEASAIPAASPMPYPIGFIGRLDAIKRVPDLVRAVAQLGDRVHLHVFGDGPERACVEQVIRELRLESQVTLHGFVARPAIALKQIGCLVLPSASEGMPMVVLEAMAAGVPVVGRDVPGVRDLVADGVTGVLAPPAGAEGLAAAIARVLDDSELRAGMIRRARDFVLGAFTWDRIVERYREMLSLNRTAPAAPPSAASSTAGAPTSIAPGPCG